MPSVTFDTHKFVKRLRDAGMPEPQAEAFVDAQIDIISDTADTLLATKPDIIRLEKGMATKAEIDRLETDIDRLEKATKADFIRLENLTKAEIDRLEKAMVTKVEFDRLETEFNRLEKTIIGIEAGLNAKIDRVEAGLNAKIDRVEATLTGDMKLLKWMLGILLGGVIALVMKAFFAG